MSVTIEHETAVLMYSILAGILCSCIFDILRALRATFNQGTVLVGISDIIFWIVSCIICFATVYSKNNGELRIYQFAAIIISSFIYFLTASPLIKRLFVNFFRFIRFIFKILLTPVNFLYKILLNVFLKKTDK